MLISDGTDTNFISSDSNFAIDSTAPSVVANYLSGWQNSDVTVTLTCTDSASGVSTIYYRVDTNSTSTINYGDWVEYFSPLSFTNDGNYSVDFNGVDNTGFFDDANTIVVLLDKTIPIIETIPDENKVTILSEYTVNYSGSDALSGIAGYFISTNNINFVETSATNFTLVGNSGDTNIFYVKSIDNADNNSTLAVIAVTFSSRGQIRMGIQYQIQMMLLTEILKV